MNVIDTAKLEKYLDITKRALASVEPIDAKGREVIDMATRYYDDACHYREKGEEVTSFASVNYAHGWLDSGIRTGHVKVLRNRELFTVDQNEQR